MKLAAKPAGPGLIVGICFLIAALEGYDIQAFGVSAPQLIPELGLDPSRVGVAGSAAMLGLVIGAFIGGMLADRVGRKPVLLVSTVLFGVFSIVTAMSQGYDALLWARLATGIGFGGAMPNLIAIAAEISAPNKRAATITTIFCGMPAGGALVALVAGAMPDLHWRTMFLVGGVLPILIAPVIFFFLPETRPAQSAAGDRNLLKGLMGGGRAAPTLLLWLAYFVTLIVLYLMLNWLPTLVVAKGLTPKDGANAAMVFNAASIFGALILGRIVDSVGYRWPIVIAYAAMAVTLFFLASSATLTAVLALSAIAGVLVIGSQYALYGLAPGLYPPQVRAAGAGSAVAVGRIGSIVGPLLAGQLRAAGQTADQVFMVLIPLAVIAGLAILILTYIARMEPQDG